MKRRLRCANHLHGEYDETTGELVVKCRWCSKREGRDIFHRWRLVEPVLHPLPEPQPAPIFVHWIVQAA